MTAIFETKSSEGLDDSIPGNSPTKRRYYQILASTIFVCIVTTYCNINVVASSSTSKEFFVQEIPSKNKILSEKPPITPTISSLESCPNAKKTVAVIHVGPPKSGTTTLQAFTEKFVNELKEDGYHMPYDWSPTYEIREPNQAALAACFFDDRKVDRFECEPELGFAAIEIDLEGKDMLVSTEFFSKEDLDKKKLAKYLEVYDEVIVCVFYRRYFEWFVSYWNERVKGRINTPTLDHWLWDHTIFKLLNNYYEKEMDILPPYTYSIIQRLEENFDNIKVVNMHNGKDNNVQFFCEVIPNANHTCEAVKALQDEGVESKNPSKDTIYEDLAYSAMRRGMIQIKTQDQMTHVINAIYKYHEGTRGLTKNDFPLICPSARALDKVLRESLMIEEALFPEFFKSPDGEESLRASFDKYSTTKLCSLDADKALSDTVWIDFFKKFSY